MVLRRSPSLWGSLYNRAARAGLPPGLSMVCAALLGAALPALVHRSLSDEEWAVPNK